MRRCDQTETRKVSPREAGDFTREKRNFSKGDLEARVRSKIVLRRKRYHNRLFFSSYKVLASATPNEQRHNKIPNDTVQVPRGQLSSRG